MKSKVTWDPRMVRMFKKLLRVVTEYFRQSQHNQLLGLAASTSHKRVGSGMPQAQFDYLHTLSTFLLVIEPAISEKSIGVWSSVSTLQPVTLIVSAISL